MCDRACQPHELGPEPTSVPARVSDALNGPLLVTASAVPALRNGKGPSRERVHY